MKILYVDPVVDSATSSNYQYYDGVYKELINHHEVAIFRGNPYDIKKLRQENNFDADAVIFGLGWFNNKYFDKIENIDIPSICILFKPQNDLEQKFEDYQALTGVKSKLYTYGFDPDVFYDRKNEKKYDIGFSGALHESKYYSPGAFPTENIRTKIGELLNSRRDINVFWSSSDSRPSRIPSYEDYANKLNSSKIWIATQAAYGDITPRYYEIVGSKTLLLCQKIPNQYRHIFRDGKNCVEFEHDLSNFEEKLDFYLKNEEERFKIVDVAYKEFKSKHTWKNKADELLSCIKGI